MKGELEKRGEMCKAQDTDQAATRDFSLYPSSVVWSMQSVPEKGNLRGAQFYFPKGLANAFNMQRMRASVGFQGQLFTVSQLPVR